MRWCELFFAVVFASACADESGEKSVALIVEVIDDQDLPFNRARVFIEGKDYGGPDDRGRVTAEIRGPEGRPFEVRVSCPNGWDAIESANRELKVRFLKPLGRSGAVPAPMDEVFRCVPVTRKIVLLVRSDGRAGLLVKAMGRELTRTDEDGVAQSVVEGIPGDEIEIEIDTSANPELRPAMPSRRFAMPEKNQILIFDQKFETKKAKMRKRKRRSIKHAGPRRI